MLLEFGVVGEHLGMYVGLDKGVVKVIELGLCGGDGAGPVTRSPLMFRMGHSCPGALVCLTRHMQSCSGVVWTSSVDIGVWMA